MKKGIIPIFTVICILVIISCEKIFEDKHQERFEDPEWLDGSILETLQEDTTGFDIFLALMDRAGYTDKMERGIYSLFVANDESYREYFSSIGIDSVGQLSNNDARQLFELCVINSPRSEHQLIYDYIFGAWQGPGSEYGALIFRIKTLSKSPPQKELVQYHAQFEGQTLDVVSSQKFIPVFSTEFFRDFNGATDGSDYNYFFPDVQWENKLVYNTKWYNANLEIAKVCSNGYIYFLDKAVPIIYSIEEYLRNNQDKYGLYYDIAQRFARYSYAGRLDDPEQTMVYTKSYTASGLLGINFADENGPSGTDAVYQRRSIYSALIPTDEALQDYLDNTVFKYYSSIDSVPEVTLTYILQAHLTKHFELPSKMAKTFFNYYSDIIPIDPYNDVIEATILSNGAFFGLNRVLEPLAFKTVTGPLFFNSNYTTFLYALNASGLMTSLTKDDIKATVFAPPNEALLDWGINYNKSLERLEKRRSDGVWEEMEELDIIEFVQDHFIYQELDNLMEEGYLVTRSENIFYHKDNKIISGGNAEDNDEATITEIIDSKINGKLMLMDNVIKAPKKSAAQHVTGDPDFLVFFQLCVQADLIDSITIQGTLEKIPRIKFMIDAEKWTGFIPDNNAVTTAIANGDIPQNTDSLARFVRYHFIPDAMLVDFYEHTGTYETAASDTLGTPLNLNLNITPGKLDVTDKTGQVITVAPANANIMVSDGIYHKITSVFKLD
jgi:uncharacterized surface protein with fasciclin (FAS1) repeats